MSQRDNPFSSSIPGVWPFVEAAKLANYMREKNDSSNGVALLETGYGPSGLPHIGTFGEVVRTSWVKQAYEVLTNDPARIIVFSDDMDGLRKIPDNVPDRVRLTQFIGQPLSRVPDPFGTHDSFGSHNNARLRDFLDRFGFDYEFASASDYYAQGRFDLALKQVLRFHDDIINIIRPSLGCQRRETYSPILPIHPCTGVVMQVPIDQVDLQASTVFWTDEKGQKFETLVTGGHAKLQWKADWAMRWCALDVDYEMSGKDLIDSVSLSSKICRVLGKEPPVGLTYELFLDEQGHKISKSKGNGLTVDEWLRYASRESLAQFMFNSPQRAKRLYFGAIPKASNEYISNVEKYHALDVEHRYSNPVWFIHKGQVPDNAGSPVSFTMLLNLASVTNAEHVEILWAFLRRYNMGSSDGASPLLEGLVHCAIQYYRDFVKPQKIYRDPSEKEQVALRDLADQLIGIVGQNPDGVELQNLIFSVGKKHKFEPLRLWFSCLYEVLLGQKEGPRFGVFVAIYGIVETVNLIEHALKRSGCEQGSVSE